MKKILLTIFLIWTLLFAACEETDILTATDAGLDAIKAVTLSDQNVKALALKASRDADMTHRIAPVSNPYGKRLHRLAGSTFASDGYEFNFKVYLSPTVNAFAMADGTIRIYSGLMDMLNDNELLFVIGHEMGHVVEKHVKNKIRVAYAARAIRKGIASQEGIAGDIARSALGGLMEVLLNAQFSQQEEREADDYGTSYLQGLGISSQHAVTALEKLATLGNSHSFLSSHPAPDARADRIRSQASENIKPSGYEKIKLLIIEIIQKWI